MDDGGVDRRTDRQKEDGRPSGKLQKDFKWCSGPPYPGQPKPNLKIFWLQVCISSPQLLHCNPVKNFGEPENYLRILRMFGWSNKAIVLISISILFSYSQQNYLYVNLTYAHCFLTLLCYCHLWPLLTSLIIYTIHIYKKTGIPRNRRGQHGNDAERCSAHEMSPEAWSLAMPD